MSTAHFNLPQLPLLTVLGWKVLGVNVVAMPHHLQHESSPMTTADKAREVKQEDIEGELLNYQPQVGGPYMLHRSV